MKKLTYLLLALVLLASPILTGCQQDILPDTDVSGQILNLYGMDPYTLDPAVAGDATSNTYITQLFSGLVRLDEDLEPAPDIAQSWQVSQDGRTYTFQLRSDVLFHDGRPVTAEDFSYSWQRACDPDTGSQTAATYLGDIVGVKAVLAGEADEISGVRVLDDYTLEVTIDEPKAYFLSKLAYVTAFVVDRNNVESADDWWRQPNGTGPFKLKQWSEDNFLTLERNELYYGDLARLDFVVFYLLAGRPMDMYETGVIDVSPVNAAYIDKVRDEAGPFYQDLVVVPQLSFYFIGFNSSKPPFDDANIRLAFSMALDRDKLVSLVYKDTVEPAAGILPPGLPGYNDDLAGITYDVDRARQLIADSAYGDVSNLPPITLTAIGWGGLIAQELEAIISQWRTNLGVEVKVRQLEPERYLYYLKQEKNELFYMGWIADYPHPQNFLEVLFHSQADNNWADYSNPELDALLEMAAVETDGELSLELYQQAEQMIIEDAACWPFQFGQNYILVKPYVKGYRLSPLGLPILSGVTIEPH